MNNEEKVRNVREIIKDWAAQSTSHGIPRIASSPFWLIKIMWIIFFMASFGFCAFCLVDSFREFLKFSVNTQTSIVTVSSLDFPTVTFCNQRAFKTDEPNFPIRNQFFNAYNELALTSMNASVRSDNLHQITLGLDQVTKSLVNSDLQNIIDPSKISYSIDEMLISCSFNLIKCSKEDFEHFWSNTYGNCYQFNKKNPLKSSTFPGRLTGLKLDLYAGRPKNELAFYRSSGIIIFIHKSYNTPMMITEGLTLATGFETEIAINQIIVKRLPSPHDNCVETYDSKLYKKTVELNSNVYRQKFCLLLCLEQFLIEKCGCYEINSFKIPDSRLCNFNETINCAYNEGVKFYNGADSESAKCLEQCPQECITTSFNIKTYQSNYPTPYYANMIMNYADNSLRNLTSIEEIRETSLAVNIYFDELTNTTIEEQPNKTPIQLVSDIGGSLGLFIGISLLSIAEIFELILELLIHCLSANNRKISNSDKLFIQKMKY